MDFPRLVLSMTAQHPLLLLWRRCCEPLRLSARQSESCSCDASYANMAVVTQHCAVDDADAGCRVRREREREVVLAAVRDIGVMDHDQEQRK